MRRCGLAGRKNTGFRSIESRMTQGDKKGKEPVIDVAYCRNVYVILSKIDLSEQACSDLDDSC